MEESMLFMSERIPMRTVSESIYMIWMQKRRNEGTESGSHQ